jgi:RNA polymerase sigma factor (sigma-70 family)
MESNYTSLYNYGSKFSENRELIKDCIQDLFMNLWNKRETISKNVNVKAYLFSSLRRLLHRKIVSAGKHSSSVIDTQFIDSFTFHVSIEQEIITNESAARMAKKIAASLENLPARQKEVVYLKYFHNLNRDEIARAMNISPQTVSNLLQVALKKLKADFKHDFDPNALFMLLPLLLCKII